MSIYTLKILLLVLFDCKRVVVEYDVIQIRNTFSVHNSINIPKLLGKKEKDSLALLR